MIERENSADDHSNLLVIKASGALMKEDYTEFNHWIDDILKNHEKARLVCELHDFRGWGEASAAWEDAKFGIKHSRDLEKFAMIGDKKWEKWMANIAKHFMPGEVKYFDQSEKDAALNWIDSQDKQ